MNLRTCILATYLLFAVLATHAFAGETVVAIKIDGKKCTIAASDTVVFQSIRDIITALKSRDIAEIQITDEHPERLPRDAEYIAIRWMPESHVQITATGRTKHGYITTITSMLADAGAETTTISVLPDDIDSINKHAK